MKSPPAWAILLGLLLEYWWIGLPIILAVAALIAAFGEGNP